jgi:hypothetical protein
MLTDATFGRIVPGRDPAQLAESVAELLKTGADRIEQRSRARAHATSFDWTSISHAQHELMANACRAGSMRHTDVTNGAVLSNDPGR